MKSRMGFVSNSSSSSFVVIEPSIDVDFVDNIKKRVIELDNVVYAGENGEYEFGWQEETYNDLESKLNWVVLQAMSTDKLVELCIEKNIQDVLSSTLGLDVTFINNLTSSYGNKETGEINRTYGYIDHQSVGEENARMLYSEEDLRNFLFNPRSYIQNDNDNH